MLDEKLWSREEVERHSVDMRQFIDFRQSTLPNGLRIIDAYNAGGLNLTILPDRGLDIWTAHYKGIPLTWISRGSPFPPDFGRMWLEQFNGGLLVTCGLTHVGAPETDETTGQFHDLHGLYSRLRAVDLTARGGWQDDDYAASLSGTVFEAALHRYDLRLERVYHLPLRVPSIEIQDCVTNVGDEPHALMILHHFNVGYPLVAGGARLHIPTTGVYPRTDDARAGRDTWADYSSAIPRFAEQVFFHHCKADAHSITAAALINGDFGLLLEWKTDTLRYFTQWKDTRQGNYICGIEPGNCIPEGLNAAQRNGRIVTLQPGESHDFWCKLTVLDGAEAVASATSHIDDLNATGAPVSGIRLDDYAP
jgi:galactose mutarotase-like enzyme